MQTSTDQSTDVIEAELAHAVVQIKAPLLERLLSPQSLQWMMASGGGLLVLGFAVWLWSIGVFENAMVLALALGGANLGSLGLGIWLSQFTRMKLAGRGLALLSSVVLPLNLWLYDSQGLVVLNEGGPLWLAALVCCVIYAWVARLTKDSLFVYTLVGGIALTGTLFLAGSPGILFWSVIPLSVFLVSLGAICVYFDSWFLDNNGPFTRDKFGKAFFNSGHVVLSIGITLIGGGLFGDILSEAVADVFQTPTVMKLVSGKIWVLGLLIVSAATYFYSNMTRRKHMLFVVMGVLMSALAIVQAAVVLQIHITLSGCVLLLAALLILMNVFRGIFYRVGQLNDGYSVGVGYTAFLISGFGLLGCFQAGELFVSWVNVALMVLPAIILVTLPGFWHRRNLSKVYLPLSLASASVAFACFSGAAGLGFAELAFVSAFVTVLVVGVAFTSLIPQLSAYSSIVGNAFLTVSLCFWFSSMLFAGEGFTDGVSFAVSAFTIVACGLFSFSNANRVSIGLGSLCSILTLAQLVVLFNLTNGYAIIIATMVVGLSAIAVAKVLARSVPNALTRTSGKIHIAGNSMICAAVAGASLFGLSSLATGDAGFSHVGLLVLQLFAVGIAGFSTKSVGWRRGFMAAAMVSAASTIILMANLSILTFFQRAEIFCIAMGAVTVIMGYIGWARETDASTSDIVSFNLIAGSCILVLPFMVGIVGDRTAETSIDAWRYLHEIGGLVVALGLLGSGILCRIRSTTVSGATLLSVFVLSSILLINIPDQLQQTSVLMMIGGGLFFGISIVLSIYRDALMALPAKVREGKGVFQILKWR